MERLSVGGEGRCKVLEREGNLLFLGWEEGGGSSKAMGLKMRKRGEEEKDRDGRGKIN